MEWPQGVLDVLERLDRAGYGAWAVGGCVRDLLLGRVPHDWDICTSATPGQMRSALADLRLIDTGLRHGTLTVLTPRPIEVTTYRVDGPYADHRRPDQVRFVDRLEEDLARRDFTVNAMALRPDRPLVDLFGGRADLVARRIRCVGQPHLRFEEDALRMLRCLRFAAQLDFFVEEQTAQALRQGWAALNYVSAERIGAEYQKLLCGPRCGGVLAGFRPQIEAVTPLRPGDLSRIDQLPPRSGVRMGYILASAACLDRLRLDRRTRERVQWLCRMRDQPPPACRGALLALLGQAGEQALEDLLAIHAAQGEDLSQARALLNGLLAQGAPCRLADLALKGDDLTALGLKGSRVGRTLNRLLEEVMEGRLPNRREALLAAVKRFLPPEG